MTPTPEQIEAWERELGYDVDEYSSDAFLAAFAALAYAAGAAAEREACAKVCDDYGTEHGLKGDDNSKAQGWMMWQCAAAIRARKP